MTMTQNFMKKRTQTRLYYYRLINSCLRQLWT